MPKAKTKQLTGHLTQELTGEIRSLLMKSIDTTQSEISLDLSAVETMSCGVLQLMIAAQAASKARGISLEFKGANSRVERTLAFGCVGQ